ncbi:class I SAM-dependent methyltransferase [Pseudonocardia sp.]|uniref:class I SAM-dependent methyltransferase n=1 Tax=Pseudonocardia sp. TaxID=60912 RepID=UPI003D10F4C8
MAEMTSPDAVAGRIVEELGVTLATVTIAVGVRSGLWTALAGAGPLGPEELAERTGVAPVLAREWCRTQVAGGYLRLAGGPDERYVLPDEVSAVLVHGPLGGLVDAAMTMMAATGERFDEFTAAFAAGRGFGWAERADGHAHGVDMFTRAALAPGFLAAAVRACGPGVADALDAGGALLDVGCGYGAPTLTLAEEFPAAAVTGCDFHDASIVAARKAAAEAGLAQRVRFEVATATQAPAVTGGYALVVFVDSLHDLGDPAGALARARELLGPGGAVLLVEPRAADRVVDNLNPVGRMFYAVSTMFCTPTAVAQGGPDAGTGAGATPLGTLAGPAALTRVAAQAGLSRVRELPVEAPFNLVLELRP